jgi:hypothetical protein
MPLDSAEFFSAHPPVRPSDASPPYSRPSGWRGVARALAAGLRRRFHPAPEPLDVAVLRVLEEARGLVEQREDWTRGSYESWRGERCAVGAVRLAAEFLDYPAAGTAAHLLLAEVARRRGYSSVEAMNDRSRHDEVVAAFDEALAVASWYADRA